MGLTQVSFADLFKHYVQYLFSEREGKKIYFSKDSYLFYDELAFESFQYLRQDKAAFEIKKFAKNKLIEGKTLFITSKQPNVQFFDYLLLNTDSCYMIGVKVRTATHIYKNLRYLVSTLEFHEEKIYERFKLYKANILQTMNECQELNAAKRGQGRHFF